MEQAAQPTKDELLAELAHYPAERVGDVLARTGQAIGDENAENFDVDLHILLVATAVLREQWRREVGGGLGPQLNETGELLWLFDGDERIVAVTDEAAASLGYTPEELVGKSNRMLQAPGQDWQPHRRELERNGEHDGQTLALTKDGRTATVEHRARMFPRAGGVVFLVRTRVLLLALSALALLQGIDFFRDVPDPFHLLQRALLLLGGIFVVLCLVGLLPAGICPFTRIGVEPPHQFLRDLLTGGTV